MLQVRPEILNYAFRFFVPRIPLLNTFQRLKMVFRHTVNSLLVLSVSTTGFARWSAAEVFGHHIHGDCHVA